MANRHGTLRWLNAHALIAHLVILLVCAGTSIAGDGGTGEPVTAPLSGTSTASGSMDADPNEKKTSNTFDETHDQFERDILERVIRIDNFFGNVNTGTQQKTGYQLRWRNSLRQDEGGKTTLGTSLWANLRLSRASERLRLVFSGEKDTDPLSSSLPQDPGNPGFDRNSPSMRVVNTELRYSLIDTSAMDMFLGAGVRLRIPTEAFLRTRFQYTYKIDDSSQLRLAETLFIKSSDRLGETTEVYLERLIDKKTLVRWANSGTYSHEIKGLEWGSELSLIRELSPRSGITLTGGGYGNTSIYDGVGNYRTLVRYRRNFLRRWLFYEVEPEVAWQRRADGNFSSNAALTFRLEIMFQGKEK